MSFLDAIKSGYKNYVNFNGRARRSEFWFFTLFVFLVEIVLIILGGATGGHGGGNPLFSGLLALFGLGTFLPSLGLTVRRLHDTNHSGWWIFISLVPLVGTILLLIWYATPGKAEPNKYGASPIQAPANVASVF